MTVFQYGRRSALLFVFAMIAALLISSSQSLLAQEGDAKEGAEVKESVQTLQSVLNLTYLNNPNIRSARAELRAVEEALPQALSNWIPSVSASAGITADDVEGSSFGGGGDGTTAKNVGVSVEQSLFRGGRTFAETRGAKYTIKAQAARLVLEEQDILLQAATAYMDVVSGRASLDLSKGNQEVIAKQLEATRDRFEVGELTKTDVQQAVSRLANAEAQVITTRGDLRNNEAVFEQLTGFKPQNLEQPYLELPLPIMIDDAISYAEKNNPNVVAAIGVTRAAEEDIDNVFGELLPQIGLTASWDRTYDPSPGIEDRQTNRAIGVSASIPLYQSGAVRSRVRQAKHVANQRTIEVLEAKRLARQQAVRAWEDLQTAKAEIRSREAQVEAALIAQEGVRAEADFGARTVLDALDADQELLDAQVALVNSKRDKVVAEFTLLSVLGQLTPENLGFPESAQDYERDINALKWNFFNMDVDRVGER